MGRIMRGEERFQVSAWLDGPTMRAIEAKAEETGASISECLRRAAQITYMGGVQPKPKRPPVRPKPKNGGE